MNSPVSPWAVAIPDLVDYQLPGGASVAIIHTVNAERAESKVGNEAGTLRNKSGSSGADCGKLEKVASGVVPPSEEGVAEKEGVRRVEGTEGVELERPKMHGR